ncbi:MAG TPA: phosphotransferase [Clostridiales bacterium]|nr:phosphotransferase [Clostridiales bacterium]
MLNYTQLKMINQGNTAEIFQIDDKKILKLYRSGLPFPLCEKEFENTRIAKKLIGNVPLVYELIKDNDRCGIVFQKITGKDMITVIAQNIWQIKRQAKNLAKFHFDMQKENSEHLQTVKEKLLADIETVECLSKEEKHKLFDYINALSDGNALCHFDYHPGNIIISSNKPIIIDWMTACIGCKCADIARTGILLKYGQMTQGNLIIRKLVPIVQKHIYKIYIYEYKKISGTLQEDIDVWELPILAARLREWISEKEKSLILYKIREQLRKL